jgi:hypothetical protein
MSRRRSIRREGQLVSEAERALVLVGLRPGVLVLVHRGEARGGLAVRWASWTPGCDECRLAVAGFRSVMPCRKKSPAFIRKSLPSDLL